MTDLIKVGVEGTFTAVIFLSGFLIARSGLLYASGVSLISQTEGELRRLEQAVALQLKMTTSNDLAPGGAANEPEASTVANLLMRQRTSVLRRTTDVTLEMVRPDPVEATTARVVLALIALAALGTAFLAWASGVRLGRPETLASVSGATAALLPISAALVAGLWRLEATHVRQRFVSLAATTDVMVSNLLVERALSYQPVLRMNAKDGSLVPPDWGEHRLLPPAAARRSFGWEALASATGDAAPAATCADGYAQLRLNLPSHPDPMVAAVAMATDDLAVRSVLELGPDTVVNGLGVDTVTGTVRDLLASYKAAGLPARREHFVLQRIWTAAIKSTEDPTVLIRVADDCYNFRPNDLWTSVAASSVYIRGHFSGQISLEAAQSRVSAMTDPSRVRPGGSVDVSILAALLFCERLDEATQLLKAAWEAEHQQQRFATIPVLPRNVVDGIISAHFPGTGESPPEEDLARNSRAWTLAIKKTRNAHLRALRREMDRPSERRMEVLSRASFVPADVLSAMADQARGTLRPPDGRVSVTDALQGLTATGRI